MCKERVEHSLSATDESTRDQPLPKCKCPQTTDKWLSYTTPPTTTATQQFNHTQPHPTMPLDISFLPLPETISKS